MILLSDPPKGTPIKTDSSLLYNLSKTYDYITEKSIILSS